ncbi:hypothetical protein ATJ97_1979 [Georgenia soli]|uniref:Uncharacterized protein n=1 Tax=Georgenia soli TaxID=638953 RepID=A0A2A9EL03_9MICO|nr:hypothetical protein [Georgenia soli]PFG39473.1 hypothetical protein ATJ97_1979 [Georgenia soli]
MDQPSPSPHALAPWEPFTLTVRREDAPTRESDVAAVLHARGVLGAVVDGDVAALPGRVLVRVAVDDDARVATAGADGVPRPGTDVDALVVALARHLRATVLVDAPTTVGPGGGPVLAVGPDGTPAEPVEPELDEAPGRVRSVHAWRGEGLVGARALVAGARLPLTAHRLGPWMLAVADDGTYLEPEPPGRWSFGFPYVAMSRSGELRAVTYVAGKGRRALYLELSWAPPMAAVVPASVPEGSAAERLAQRLRTARLGEGDLPEHPDLDPGVGRALVAAAQAPDGDHFLAAVAAALGLPAEIARVVEAPGRTAEAPGATAEVAGATAEVAGPTTRGPGPDAVSLLGPGERIEATGTARLMGAALRDDLVRAPSGNDPFSRLRRYLHRRPRLHLTVGLFELFAAVMVGASLLGFWSDQPSWLRILSCVLLAVDGLGNTAMAWWRLRRDAARV